MSKFKTILRSFDWLLRPNGLHHQIDELGTHVDELTDSLARLHQQIGVVNNQIAALRSDSRLAEILETTRLSMRLIRSQAWVYGHQMLLDPDDTVVSLLLRSRGSFEDFETELVLQEVRPGDFVIDVGANIGYYTLLFARQVGPQGRVFAFEPDPHNFAILRQNVLQNGYTNVTCVPCAVSDRAGSLRLFRNEGNRGDHRIYDSSDGRASVEVPSMSLDEYFRDAPHPIHFIKMDIQGAEAKALQGMRQQLERSPSVKLMTEFWPRGLMLCGNDGRQYLEELRSFGFSVNIIDGKVRQLVPADFDGLLAKLPVEPDHDIGFANLYCKRAA